ncbi:MAG: NAD(P)H-hydrate dehydratase [Candidatus Heimdallarchaeota archaeon]|nr:NAD(P)H-hydrate dehydratase [Candidatus Heimdallarchaeota archaeon]
MNSEKITSLDMAITDVNSEFLGINRRLLMENAGSGLVHLILKIVKEQKTEMKDFNVVIFAGKGGNGGDGMVVARHISRYYSVALYLLGIAKEIEKQSTLENWKILENIQESVSVHQITQVEQVKNLNIKPNSLIIDALLGTGLRGEIREPLASLIKAINASKRQGSIVLSIDTPSGIDPDSGKSAKIFVKADYTGVLHKQKIGLKPENSGKIHIIPIGIPKEAEFVVGPGDLKALKNRSNWSKKGDNGKILVIGGNELYTGAPALSGLAAICAGADLVTLFVPSKISGVIRSYSPELIVKEFNGNHLAPEFIPEKEITENDVIVIGPGLGRQETTKQAIHEILNLEGINDHTIIIDADALKLINLSEISSNTILTPHAGEFALMTGIKLPQSQDSFNHRLKLFLEISKENKGIWVLKGHWDVITNGVRFKINKSGTPWMTRGGTGDVLAGLIAGLVSQSISPFHASCIGTYINGRAGELSGERFGINDLLKNIPIAIRESLDFIRKD